MTLLIDRPDDWDNVTDKTENLMIFLDHFEADVIELT